MRIWTSCWVLWVVAGCATDAADQALFACETDEDCRPGWFCNHQVCRAEPPDMRIDRAMDGAVSDRGLQDMQMPDARPDRALPDMRMPDMRMPDRRVPDMQPDMDGPDRPDMASPLDTDGDGVLDDNDNCPLIPNPNQENFWGQRFGDHCRTCDEGETCKVYSDGGCQADRCQAQWSGRVAMSPCVEGYCAVVEEPRIVEVNCTDLERCQPTGRAVCVSDPACDTDGDGVGDTVDNCPQPNPDQADRDADGRGDRCDNCVDRPNVEQLDPDEDGRGNRCDNCPDRFNPNQSDADGDMLGDACDPDADGDNTLDVEDNCTGVPNPAQLDRNENGIGDRCECDAARDACRVLLGSYCDAIDQCGATLIREYAAGECDRGRCVPTGALEEDEFIACGDALCAPPAGVVRPLGYCVDSAVCIDRDADGLPDRDEMCRDTPNPGMQDLCPDCQRDGDCEPAEYSFCMPQLTGLPCEKVKVTANVRASCVQDSCAVDLGFEECVDGFLCVTINNRAECVQHEPGECEPACTPDLDGMACVDDDGAAGRCVSGACRAWNCTDLVCNDNGPRRYDGRPIVFDPPENDGGPIRDTRNGLVWSALRPEATLAQAHQDCANLGAPNAWRLPTIWELVSLTPRTDADRDALVRAFGGVPGAMMSRTVTLTGRLIYSPASRDLRDRALIEARPYRCVRPIAAAIRSVTRRERGVVRALSLDRWTGLRWRFAEVRVGRLAAAMVCNANERLPHVEELVSTMVWRSVPAPSLWPIWQGADFPSTRSFWSSDATGDGTIVVNMASGSATRRADEVHSVACVTEP